MTWCLLALIISVALVVASWANLRGTDRNLRDTWRLLHQIEREMGKE